MHTDSDRTRDSATHFATGLFGADQLNEVYFPEPTYEDLKTLEVLLRSMQKYLSDFTFLASSMNCVQNGSKISKVILNL